MSDSFNKLTEICASIFDTPIDDIQIDSTQDNIKGWDSLATVRLITELEKEFEVQFDIMEMVELNSLKSTVKILENKGVVF